MAEFYFLCVFVRFVILLFHNEYIWLVWSDKRIFWKGDLCLLITLIPQHPAHTQKCGSNNYSFMPEIIGVVSITGWKQNKGLYEFPVAAATSHHKFSGLKQPSLCSCCPRGQKSAVVFTELHGRCWRAWGVCSSPLPASRGCWLSWPRSLVTPTPASVVTLLSLLCLLSLCPLLTKILMGAVEAHPDNPGHDPSPR